MSEPNGEPPEDPLIGTEIASRYLIVSRLGEGGMGVVYEGVHGALGRSVAIKVLRPAWASDTEAVERFFREARTAAGIGHPNICDVYDLGRLPNERPYMVMPRLEGDNLAKLLESTGGMPTERVLELLRGPASALDAVHKRGLIHRDIKPENLVLGMLDDGQEIVRLVDFGLATLTDGRDSRLTREGFVCGTPHYMPPEAARGDLPDARGDVYSLAVVAFELISGRLPIDSPNPLTLLATKIGQKPPLLSEVSEAEIPVALDSVFERALSIDPALRHSTAGELIRAFADAIGRDLPRTSTPKRTEEVPWTALMQRSDPPPAPAAVETETRGSPAVAEQREAETGEVRRGDIPGARSPRRFVVLAFLAALAVGLVAVVVATHGGDGPARTSAHDGTVHAAAHEPTAPPTTTVGDVLSPAHEDERARPVEAPPVVADDNGEPTPTAPRSRPRGHGRGPAPTHPPTPVTSAAHAAGEQSAGDPAVRGRTDLPPVPARDAERARDLTREGTSALVTGRIPRAVELFRDATLAHPGYAPAWRGLGLAYQQLGQGADSRRAYGQYLRLAPNAPDADDIRSRMAQN